VADLGGGPGQFVERSVELGLVAFDDYLELGS
jgi:hypothetical protein